LRIHCLLVLFYVLKAIEYYTFNKISRGNHNVLLYKLETYESNPKGYLIFVVLSLNVLPVYLFIINPSKILCNIYRTPFQTKAIPQIIMLSFTGTINAVFYEYYDAILAANKNPNGCDVTSTFFITDDGTDYKLAKSLYDRGCELGVNSLKGQAPSSSTGWITDIKGNIN